MPLLQSQCRPMQDRWNYGYLSLLHNNALLSAVSSIWHVQQGHYTWGENGHKIPQLVQNSIQQTSSTYRCSTKAFSKCMSLTLRKILWHQGFGPQELRSYYCLEGNRWLRNIMLFGYLISYTEVWSIYCLGPFNSKTLYCLNCLQKKMRILFENVNF
jgi:hypothetical protein